ncbi:type 4a pilus biogenesis protein PilO [Campylobacter sp. Marseille-Q3452]|uniref:Type 4a pilus biogenesis protein PilO n=1 Tax=Campylobacter massiliensis TaxID=2762557 RepID=A0A842J707_9BACT|nr:type 4a pilus biogenesis protein PilO [Campylobacter massiliensis]MBC2883258.1 type 4a pilus biogenesis protein PilO [Campylobacter massiliensis]
MKKDNTLVKIDNYFDGKKPSEVTLMLIMALVLSGVIAYYAVIQYAEDYYDNSMLTNSQTTDELNKVNAYLDSVSQNNDRNNDRNFKINQKQNELKQRQNELADAKNMNQYFDNKLRELSYLIFNEQSWADFLDSLALLANKNNVKITKIVNTFKEPNAQKIEQILDINVSVDGNYKDIIGYINAIEESKLVVDVNGIDINSTDGKLKGNMGIYIWGMKYQ